MLGDKVRRELSVTGNYQLDLNAVNDSGVNKQSQSTKRILAFVCTSAPINVVPQTTHKRNGYEFERRLISGWGCREVVM